MDSTYSLSRKLERLLKKLEKRSKPLVDSFYEQVNYIIKDPESGSLLKQDLQGYYSWDWSYRDVPLRICYTFDIDRNHVTFVYFGTRQNFYKEVKRYLG